MKWTINNSWDEIMTRLEELEKTVLPYKLKNINRGTNEFKYQIEDDTENVCFSYEITSNFVSASIWFTLNHQYSENVFFLKSVVNKKQAVVSMLNKWENYLNKKIYEKDKAAFDAKMERLSLIKKV